MYVWFTHAMYVVCKLRLRGSRRWENRKREPLPGPRAPAPAARLHGRLLPQRLCGPSPLTGDTMHPYYACICIIYMHTSYEHTYLILYYRSILRPRAGRPQPPSHPPTMAAG